MTRCGIQSEPKLGLGGKKEKKKKGGGDACPYAKALRVDIHNIGFVLISFTKVITSPSPSIKKKGGGGEGADSQWPVIEIHNT